MSMSDASNPYAPPQATVRDIADPLATTAPADRGSRLGASILDTIIFMLLVYFPIGLAAIVGAGGGNANTALLLGGLLGTTGFVAWSWVTIVNVKRNGQSLGKKMVGIKVVRVGGTPVSLGRVFWLRNVVNGLLSIIPLYGIIDVLFIFGESRQCLHDKLADTIVVKA